MRPNYCPDCGSPRIADLDAEAGLWVCDECGFKIAVYGETVEPFTRPGAENITPSNRYL